MGPLWLRIGRRGGAALASTPGPPSNRQKWLISKDLVLACWCCCDLSAIIIYRQVKKNEKVQIIHLCFFLETEAGSILCENKVWGTKECYFQVFCLALPPDAECWLAFWSTVLVLTKGPWCPRDLSNLLFLSRPWVGLGCPSQCSVDSISKGHTHHTRILFIQ